MGILIDIKKSLPGFKLQIKLSNEQDIIGVLGASGAGKSMLLKCIAGLVKPDEGKIILNKRTLFDSAQKNQSAASRTPGRVFVSELRAVPASDYCRKHSLWIKQII